MERNYTPEGAQLFRVPPDLSDLGRSPTVEKKFQDRYPNIAFSRGCVVDGAVLIQDMLPFGPEMPVPFSRSTMVSLPQLLVANDMRIKNLFQNSDIAITKRARELNTSASATLQVVSALEQTIVMQKIIGRSLPKTSNALYVFPGEGAETVRRYMAMTNTLWNSTEDIVCIPCQRIPVAKGKFEVNTDFSLFKDDPNPDRDVVVIVDDVISTGQTIQVIAKGIRENYPNARVVAATWLMVKPSLKVNEESPSGIEGVDMTFASIILEGNSMSRPPINSLSCFKRNGDKYDEVKNSFIQKYISDQKAFQQILDEMRVKI